MNRKLIIFVVGALLVGMMSGIGIMLNEDAYSSVQNALGQESTHNSVVTGVSGMDGFDLNSMDIETALMMVQTERSRLLDEQLKSQIDNVTARNDQIAKLNELLNTLRAILSEIRGTDAGSPVSEMSEDRVATANSLATELGIGFDRLGTRGELDAAITSVKGMIDAESNSQQMDMLRLQSLSNKRNEAFDTMTNLIKKMQDSRSSIIGNMR